MITTLDLIRHWFHYHYPPAYSWFPGCSCAETLHYSKCPHSTRQGYHLKHNISALSIHGNRLLTSCWKLSAICCLDMNGSEYSHFWEIVWTSPLLLKFTLINVQFEECTHTHFTHFVETIFSSTLINVHFWEMCPHTLILLSLYANFTHFLTNHLSLKKLQHISYFRRTTNFQNTVHPNVGRAGS